MKKKYNYPATITEGLFKFSKIYFDKSEIVSYTYCCSGIVIKREYNEQQGANALSWPLGCKAVPHMSELE